MKLELKVTGLDNVLDMLNNFPKEIVSVRGGPVKTALKRASQVIRKEVAKNLEQNISDEATGLMARSLVATRGKTNGFGEKYVVRFKKIKYTRSTGEEITTWKTARLFEYGSSKQKPRPFIRPAAQTKAQEAVNVFSKEINKEIDKLTKKYILRTGK